MSNYTIHLQLQLYISRIGGLTSSTPPLVALTRSSSARCEPRNIYIYEYIHKHIYIYTYIYSIPEAPAQRLRRRPWPWRPWPPPRVASQGMWWPSPARRPPRRTAAPPARPPRQRACRPRPVHHAAPPTVEFRLGPKTGLGLTPGELVSRSKLNPYPKPQTS